MIIILCLIGAWALLACIFGLIENIILFFKKRKFNKKNILFLRQKKLFRKIKIYGGEL